MKLCVQSEEHCPAQDTHYIKTVGIIPVFKEDGSMN